MENFETYHLQEFCNVIKRCKYLEANRGLELIQKLIKARQLLEQEIDENLLTLNHEKWVPYFRYVKKRIHSIRFDPILTKEEITPYLEQFNVSINEIVTNRVSNKQFEKLLNDYIDPYMVQETTLNFQKKFVKYFIADNARTILKYCNNILKETNVVASQKEPMNVKNNYTSKIFRSHDAEEWFESTLTQGNKLDDKGNAKRGFPALANAIFKDSDCKENIFNYDLQLKEYVEFLNSYYEANIPNGKSISDPTRHQNFVSERIALFLKSAS